jgi:tRNA-modifying protein YgfZ
MNKNPFPQGVVLLTHLGAMTAQGADAGKFLHGQLTNSIADLSLGQARLAGYCSAKGRLQASFVAFKRLPHEPVLVCAASVLQSTLKRLSMFVMRAKCTLHDATSQLPVWGAMGQAAFELSQDLPDWGCRVEGDATVIRLPTVQGVARCWVVNPSAGMCQRGSPALLSTWQGLEVLSGLPWIEAATAEKFVPQMLNYELLGGVDFQKGCYPGQEVVARSQYRGVVKRRMFLFELDEPAAAGQEVFHSAEATQPAGMVVNAAPHPSLAGWVALVELKLAALGEGSLHLGHPGGGLLRLGALPYTVSTEV